MTITRAYKTRLDPTPEQARQLARFAGAVRYVYNAALEERTRLYQQWGARVSAFDQMKELTVAIADPELAFLRETPRMALNAAIQNLDRGFAAFFRRVKRGETPGYPRFKSRSHGASIKFFSQVRIEERHIHLAKVGRVRLFERGYLPTGTVKIASGAITERAGKWFVSVTVQEEVPDPVPTPGVTVAVHAGLKQLAYVRASGPLSATETFANPRHYEKALKKLRREQRRLSRKEKGSRNRDKQRRKVARLHEHIAAQRTHTLHQVSHAVVRHLPETVVVEKWDKREMAGNRRMARSIMDAGWGELNRQIKYKSEWSGALVVEAPEQFPSTRRCAVCGREGDVPGRQKRCECGAVIDREANALLNLLALAETVATV